jgi:hypothetical protein
MKKCYVDFHMHIGGIYGKKGQNFLSKKKNGSIQRDS